MHCLISNRINIIFAVSPRIWRPTLNYTNDIHASALNEFVQRLSPLNTRSGACVMSILLNQYQDDKDNDALHYPEY